MGNLQGTNITKGRVGANTLTASDGISGIIISCVMTASYYGQVMTIYNIPEITSIAQQSLIGDRVIDTVGINAHRHLKEFFRMAGEGQKLYVMFVSPTQTMSSILESELYAKKLLTAAKGEIRQLAVAVNPSAQELSQMSYLNGLPTDVYNAIPKAQALADWAFENHMPLNILLEGYAFNGTAAAAGDLRAIENLNADKVSIVIGQDYNYAHTLNVARQKYADVGTALGTLSAATVEQNIGDNEAFNLTDATQGAWLEPGLSSHKKNEEVYLQLQTLEDKGYIFALEYAGLEGVRWNNDHVCAEIIQDAEGNINEHTIAYGRTHNKSLRLLRTALLPKVKGSYPVEPTTGKMTIGVQKYFEGIGNEVYAGMMRRNEISGGEMKVDPNSDLITEKVLKTSYRIVPYGTIGEITGTSNLKQSLG